MAIFEDVKQYIDENVFQSKIWDSYTEAQQRKAVNDAIRKLRLLLPNKYPEGQDIPVEHIAEQVIWLSKIDDMFQRADLGATSLSVDGFTISFKEKDRSLAPFILSINGVTTDPNTGGIPVKRKVWQYSSVNHTAKRYIY